MVSNYRVNGIKLENIYLCQILVWSLFCFHKYLYIYPYIYIYIYIFVEVKLEEGLSCGGAYIKLIREDENDENDGNESNSNFKFSMDDLDSDTPYTIMFGPDHCGVLNNKIHFIMQHKNDHNIHTQKHFKEMSPMLLDKKTHLYTTVIRGEGTTGSSAGSGSGLGLISTPEPNSIEYFVDMKSIKHGSLFTHMVCIVCLYIGIYRYIGISLCQCFISMLYMCYICVIYMCVGSSNQPTQGNK